MRTAVQLTCYDVTEMSFIAHPTLHNIDGDYMQSVLEGNTRGNYLWSVLVNDTNVSQLFTLYICTHPPFAWLHSITHRLSYIGDTSSKITYLNNN